MANASCFWVLYSEFYILLNHHIHYFIGYYYHLLTGLFCIHFLASSLASTSFSTSSLVKFTDNSMIKRVFPLNDTG